MQPLAIIAFSLFSVGVFTDPSATPRPGIDERVSWIQFYHRDFSEGRLSYYYAPSSIRRSNGVLSARWRVTSSSDGAITLYAIEIDCLGGRFTETGTVLIDREGRRQTLPAAELLQNEAIVSGTSGDVFRRIICR
jgi:hypothetical protein